MKSLVFKFDNPSEKDKSIKEAVRLFAQAGAPVVSTDIDKATSKRAGVTFRGVHLTMADGQTVTLNIKETGDVFEVRINTKPVPVRNQDDHKAAIAEVAARLESGRAAFQKALSKVKTAVPPSLRVSRAKSLDSLVAKRDALKEEVSTLEQRLQDLKAA
jgi:hypothetical protein